MATEGVYELRPMRVKAVQWRKPGDHPDVVTVTDGSWFDGKPILPGDWIVTTPDGKRFACNPNVFIVEYRPSVATYHEARLMLEHRDAELASLRADAAEALGLMDAVAALPGNDSAFRPLRDRLRAALGKGDDE